MVVDHIIEKFVEYCSQDETRQALDSKFVRPVIAHLSERFSWTLRAFHALTVLVGIQTLLILWLLLRSFRASAVT